MNCFDISPLFDDVGGISFIRDTINYTSPKERAESINSSCIDIFNIITPMEFTSDEESPYFNRVLKEITQLMNMKNIPEIDIIRSMTYEAQFFAVIRYMVHDLRIRFGGEAMKSFQKCTEKYEPFLKSIR